MPRKDKTFNCYKRCILHYAKINYPKIRKRKYSLKYYLDNFLLVLNDVTKWRSLSLLNKKMSEFHWKTIYNEFNRWSSDGIFLKAFNKLLKEHYFKFTKLKKHKKINMFIDVTKVSNKSGREKIGINGEYKKKNITALSAICDENNVIIGINYMENNKNKTKSGRHTIQHDVRGVQRTLNSIPLKTKKGIKPNLIGDKGYVSSNKFKVFNKKINMVYPKRKNQKKKNTKKEKKLLKNRYKIENAFADIKKYDRINVRKEHKIVNFMSFVYLGILKNLQKKFSNKNT